MGTEVDRLIELLQASLAQTLATLSALSGAELDEHSDHACAMGGSVRDLLTHNVDHERMHAGQVYSARYSLKHMQKGEVDRLMADTLRARTDLIASLIGLPDDALDARTPDDQWTIRQMIEHTLYWERHSIDDLLQKKLRARLPYVSPYPELQNVADPIYGPLPVSAGAAPAPDPVLQPATNGDRPSFPWKLWLYTNYDCNLKCSYCVAKSSPNAPRRALGLANVKRLVDEAVELGFQEVFFTGGEPFILNDIYDMLAYASARVKTTVLTNAMLLRGTRLDKLCAIANDSLIVQVSLDGGEPEHHDAYRGAGTWAKTVEGIKQLQERGFRVRLSTTETPANTAYLEKVCEFHRSLGIPDEDHFIRPLAKRGYSKEGLELGMDNLVPEITVNLDGVFWHPLSTDADMQVSKRIFPLATAVERVKQQLEAIAQTGAVPLMTFN